MGDALFTFWGGGGDRSQGALPFVAQVSHEVDLLHFQRVFRLSLCVVFGVGILCVVFGVWRFYVCMCLCARISIFALGWLFSQDIPCSLNGREMYQHSSRL